MGGRDGVGVGWRGVGEVRGQRRGGMSKMNIVLKNKDEFLG